MKKILSIMLAITLMFGAVAFVLSRQAVFAENVGDDGTTNWEFVEPVTHRKTAPSGYIGIHNAVELNNIRNNLGGNYILMNDIDLADFGDWSPIGENKDSAFTGNFNGNGYSIKNITVNVKSNQKVYAGLFGCMKNGNIRNVAMVGSNIFASSADTSYVGGVVGGVSFDFSCTSVVENCYNTGKVSSDAYESYVGGVAGSFFYPHSSEPYGNYSSVIKNCYNEGEVSSSSSKKRSFVGGIIGYYDSSWYTMDTRIDNCYNIGNVSSSPASSYLSVGGIAGVSLARVIKRCYNEGSVISSSEAGGIAGRARFIDNCHNIGSVQSEVVAGGVAGDASTIENSYNTGKVSSLNTGIESSITYAGGVAGMCDYLIEKCYNTGEVISSSISAASYAGGIVGRSTYDLSNSYNMGDVSSFSSEAEAYVGGLSGICYNQYNPENSHIMTSYNLGELSSSSLNSNSYVGGIAGSAYRNTVSRDSYLGDCFYSEKIEKAVGNDGGHLRNVVALSDSEMKEEESYLGFDFETVWNIDSSLNSGYPFLTPKIEEPDPTATPEPEPTLEPTAVVTPTPTPTIKAVVKVNSIKLNKKKISLKVKKSVQLKVTFNPKNPDNRKVKWKSSNKKRAKVNSKGKVTALRKGKVKITATSIDGKKKATCVINVKKMKKKARG